MEKRVFKSNFLKGAVCAALAVLLCAALLTCSNAAGGSDAPSSQQSVSSSSRKPGYVTLTGTVSVSGAVPQILADTPDASDNSQNGLSRSAYPGIDASGADATMEYFATATCGSDVVNGTFGSGREAKKFGIELAASKTWSVVVGVRSKTPDAEGNKKIYLQSKPWSVTPDPADPTISRNFVPVPIVTSAGKGTIELAVNYIHSVFDTSARFVSGPSGYDSLTIISSTDGNDQIYKVLNVPSGTYELCIDIMEIQGGNKFLVYSSIQTVSVADGMTTNAWVSDGSGIIDSNGTFKFDDSNATALKQSYLSSNIYVGKYSDESNSQIAAASDTNSGNWMAPLASINQAVNRINSAGKSNIDYVVHLNGKIQSDDLNNTTRITASTVTATHAKSITIVGTTGPSKDILEATKQGTPALMVTTSVPIIIKNIKLDGYSGAGSSAALDASGGAKVTIESGVEIADADLGVRVADTGSDGTTVTMKGGTISGNVTAVDLQGGDFILQGGSIPYDTSISSTKKNDVKLASGKVIKVQGDLTAVTGDKIGVTPSERKRGVKVVDTSGTSAAASAVEGKFLIADPTITSTNPLGDEWQVVAATADKALKTNAPIYVGQTPEGYAGNNDNPGTKSLPYFSIERACQDMDDASMPYTINVRGNLRAQTIPSALSKSSSGEYKAKSVLIKGVNPIPTSGENAGIPLDQIQVGVGVLSAVTSGLTVESTVPITIQNLKITGGEHANGGGLYLNSGTEVHLESGVLITDNTAKNHGGGVYCAGGKLFINEGAKICGNHVSPSSGSYGGIGLYATGNSVIEMTGGEISGNKDTSHVDVVGGGVKLEGSASFKMSGGEVKDNQVVRAGGNFYVTGGGDPGPSVTLSGSAKITGGVADSSSFSSDQDAIGGAVWLEGAHSRLDMSGGEISGNSAKSSSSKNACAGIYVSGATFTMTGGKISGNNVLGGNIQGGAIRVNGTVNISGSAYIPYGGEIGKNDVYLCSEKTVTIAGALTPPEGVTKVAAVTPSVFKRGTNILDSGTPSLLTLHKEKFSVSQDDADWEKDGVNIAGQYYVCINSPVYVVGAEGTGSTKPDGFGWGQTTGATGTKGHPFASVSAALSVLETGVIEEIRIAGLLKGAQTISGTFPSFTLKGYDSSSVINAGGASGAGSALSVDASGKTVTIQDLTITGGNADNGGGINIAAGTVKLVDGAKVTGNIASANGGGVYVGSSGTLFMCGSSLIGDSSDSTTIAQDGTAPGASSFANKAKLGGGIYNDGALYIGYSGMSGSNLVASAMTVTANSTAGYGIRRNLAESGAGVYQNSSTDVQVASGKISYNMATESGGAFYIAKKDSTTRTKVTFVQNSTAAMDSNKAAVSGGAVHIAGAFTIFSGNGHNNVAPQGGAIYLGQELNFGPYANFYDANNAKGVNDIYLEKSIWLSGKSNGGDVVASITMPDDKWIRGKGVLQSADASYTAASAGKFKTTDSDFSVVQKTSTSVTAVLSADIYVAGTASTRKHCLSNATPTDSATTRGTASSPFASIKGAMYAVNADATTITVDGTLSAAQTIDGKKSDGASIPTAVTAITVKGYKASSTATSSGMLDGGSNSSSKTMLTVNKSGLTVTIQDLTITRGNAANGGGINLAAGTVNLESGAVVNSNKASSGGYGAGVYVASGATLNIKDGSSIYSNSAYSGTITGAGVFNSGTVKMSGGSVYSNTAYNGGAFYNGGILSMTGGTIGGSGTPNSATNAGGAIYQAGTFNVSGGAFVYSGTEKSNDVYLASEKYITISANDLSSTTVATITPSSWVRGMQVLYATTDSWITINYGRFKVSDAEWNVGYYGAATADNAKRIGADLWVAGSGYASGVCATKTASDSNRGTKKQPYASIKKAAEQCWTTGKAFTINISGMITGATQEIPVANSTAGTTLASKITLTGLTGNTKDGINRNLAGSSAVAGGSALIINYQGYVDMTNLKIMGGNTTGNGGGIQINGPSTFSSATCPRVNLKSGVLIQQNQAVKGGGIYSSKAILCLSGTATVGNDGASDRSASNTAISNNINIATTAGGGIYNYNGYLYLGGAWVADAINTSGYNLTKGVYANVCSYSGTDDNSKNQAAGGIYNFGLFYMMNGNVSYNYGVNTGGVYSSTGTNAEFAMQGGKIHKNAGSGVYNAASSNFCMSGDAVIGDVDTVASSSTACSNNKGGLVNYGTARLGYSHGTTKAKLSGGIYGNYRSAGSGISHQSGTIYFDSGTIANNYNTGSGGGIYAKGAVYMTSSSSTQYSCITNNKAKNGGGIFLSGTSAKLFMSGYAIIGTSGKSAPPSSSTATGINYASTSGGGIYAESGPTIYLGYSKWSDGGSSDQATLNGGVCYNYAANGGGIYCNAASSSYPITIYINSGSINANKVYYDSGDTTYGLGGGIYANSYTTIYMGGGQISKNSAMNFGGGVYAAGDFFMYGTALIGDTGTSVATTGSYGNVAKSGGGVYITGANGRLLMGVEKEEGPGLVEENLDSNYGIRHNYANGTITKENAQVEMYNQTSPLGFGGGVYHQGLLFYMASGTIGYNLAPNGGGVALKWAKDDEGYYTGLHSSSAQIIGNNATNDGGGLYTCDKNFRSYGRINSNKATNKGGGIYNQLAEIEISAANATVNSNSAYYGGGIYSADASSDANSAEIKLSAGYISSNEAVYKGGGVYVGGGNDTFYMSGGTMSGNKVTASSGQGGAVYGTPYLSGNISLTSSTKKMKDNDIYDDWDCIVWLSGSITSSTTIYLTMPSTYDKSSNRVMYGNSSAWTNATTRASNLAKFKFTTDSSWSSYSPSNINENGYLP